MKFFGGIALRLFAFVFMAFTLPIARAEVSVDARSENGNVACSTAQDETADSGKAEFSCSTIATGEIVASGHLGYSLHETGILMEGRAEPAGADLVSYYLSTSAVFSRFAYVTGGTGLGTARFNLFASSVYGEAVINLNGQSTTAKDRGYNDPIPFRFDEIFQIYAYTIESLTPDVLRGDALSIARFSLPEDIRDADGNLVSGAQLVFVDDIGDPVPEPSTLTGLGLAVIAGLWEARRRGIRVIV
jgi:hypothetical protein